MIPILYSTVNEGSVPSNFGIGALSDCLKAEVTERRNGEYELSLVYAANGIHADEIQPNRIIKVKPNFTDDPQLFRIYKVGKTINGQFEVNGQHISYDLSGKVISSGSAGSCVAACSVLQAQAGSFTINTDISSAHSFNITEPSSVRSWFGGKSGSLLDIFGGEWKYDNYSATLKQNRGQDRGVRISYGKNLTDLSQELNMENLCTGIVPFCVDSDGFLTIGTKVATGLILDVDRDKSVDFSNDVNFESQTPVSTQLATLATNYINNHNFVTVKNTITLDFVQMGEMQDRVDLCDTVHIYFEALGISASAKCIETVWDVLEERYTSTTFGDSRTNIVDTILVQQREIEVKPSMSLLEQAVDRATKLITGNLGGYVVIHDSNGDGEPDEILIMDTNDISTATKVWRWNKNGLGYSSTGYDGTFGLAMTADGEIVADYITTGSMSGNRVRTGLIESTDNQLQIDLDAGTITAPSITLNGEDVESTLDSLVQTSVVTTYALSNSGTSIPSVFPLDSPTQPTENQPFLWAKTVYTYANGQTNTSYSISVRGANGQDGQDGHGLEILGNYNSMADLIAAHPTGSAGDAYMVGTDLVVWNTQTNSWEDVGRIQGPSGADGLWLAIDNDDDGTNANVTYTAHLMKGLTTDATSQFSSVFAWYLVNEGGVTLLAQGTNTITVARDSANYGSTIRCVCVAVIDEEPLEDYSYETITDYQGNDITVIGANNVQLIGESELYKPYAISAQFQVLSDEISSKVSQTDFNSLSNTVSTQGTAIQQNAQAITLKANQSTVNTLSNTVSQQGTAIEQNAQQITLKANTSDVNSGLNGKMATDMSNRSSSITINSGEIKFESNTVSISATNLTVTKDGQVTANLFKARNNFTIFNASNNKIMGIIFPYQQGGSIQLNDANETGRANMFVTSNGGYLYLYDNSSTPALKIRLEGATGDAYFSRNVSVTGKITGGSFGAISSTGAVSGTSLSTTGAISGSSLNVTGPITGRTTFNLNNASGSRRGIFWVGGNDDGVLTLYNSLGNPRANIAGHTGILTLNNANGDTNIYLYGQSGDADYGGTITCYNLIKTSSRKIKDNIKPIEDSEKILELQAVSFDFKDKEKGTDQRGFIAEDVAEILPNLVIDETENRPASLDYIGMIPYLQDIIKKQQAQIDYLMAEVEKLKGEK